MEKLKPMEKLKKNWNWTAIRNFEPRISVFGAGIASVDSAAIIESEEGKKQLEAVSRVEKKLASKRNISDE